MDFFLYFVWGFLLLDLGIVLFVLWKRRKKRFSEKTIRMVCEKWKSIERESADHPKSAILDADNLLDYVLKMKGYSGSLGEKLKRTSGLFSDMDAVWRAHKLRNRFAHELDAKLSDGEVRGALRSFQAALRDLGIRF